MSHHPAIVVAGYNRPDCLRRILGSLAEALVHPDTQLVISIDQGGSDEVVRVANAFDWQHGNKRVFLREMRLGVDEHNLACGDLSQEYGAIIMLEDDLFVSPHFYEYTVRALEAYSDDPRIGGLALHTQRHSDATPLGFEAFEDGSDVFFSQIACSWGQSWTAAQWSGFRQWLAEQPEELPANPGVPAMVRSWHASSWKKRYITYLVDTSRYFVYPRISLSTNFGDPGTHYDRKAPTLQRSLLWGQRDWRFVSLDESLAVYDAFSEILPDRLCRLQPDLGEPTFAVDLYGQKDLSALAAERVLTRRPATAPVRTFGQELRPHEMNIVANVPGTDFRLAAVKDCSPEPARIAAPDVVVRYPPASRVYKSLRLEQAMRRSVSWKLTRPLRSVARMLGLLPEI
jgi:hypothetical protein